MGTGKYTLDGHTPVLCDDLMEWGKWMEKRGVRKVGKTMIGRVRVSTVFLGLDHSFDNGPPILFETMVFGGPMDQYEDRYRTWDEAEVGHRVIVEQVKQIPWWRTLVWWWGAVWKESREIIVEEYHLRKRKKEGKR